MCLLITDDGSNRLDHILSSLDPLLANAMFEIHLLRVVPTSAVHDTPVDAAPDIHPSAGFTGIALNDDQPSVHLTEDRGQAMVSLRTRVAESLEDAARRHISRPVFAHLALNDEPAEQICQSAKELRADLVMVGTRGRKGVGRMVLGSVADDVIRHCTVPVLVVGPNAQ